MSEEFFSSVSTESVYILRIFISAICGGLIGYERSQRQKDAGVRTHLIVGIGAALCIVVSKYGFNDVLTSGIGYGTDASRIASNVITGVSFLGAGVIFIKGQTVKGLTTAAGIWATAAVGLAIGSGLYFTGICSTVIIIVLQIVLHKFSAKLEGNRTAGIYIELLDDTDCSFEIGSIITHHGSTLQSIEKTKQNGSLVLHTVIIPKNDAELDSILRDIRKIENVSDLFTE